VCLSTLRICKIIILWEVNEYNMNREIGKFKHRRNGMIVTAFLDENNGMFYAKSPECLYFTRHYDSIDDLYERLKNDDFINRTKG